MYLVDEWGIGYYRAYRLLMTNEPLGATADNWAMTPSSIGCTWFTVRLASLSHVSPLTVIFI